MRNAIPLGFLTLLLVAFTVFHLTRGDKATAEAAQGPVPTLAWKGIEAGMTQAKTEGKPVVVDVYTDWCSWCKKMDQTTYRDPSVVSRLRRQFVTVKLNAESQSQVTFTGKQVSEAQLAGGVFGVSGYPATLFLSPAGEPIGNLPGYIPPADYAKVLAYIGDGHYQKQTFDEYLQATASAETPKP